MTNQDIVAKFFEYYQARDLEKLKEVVDQNVVWYFLGRHKLAGVKKGLEELLEFFDTMGGIMKDSKPEIEKLIVAENDRYVIECQRIKTNRQDGINIDHHATVLWTIENGKIISGRHFFADPEAADQYFNAVPVKQ
jgi:uncharacterized protein